MATSVKNNGDEVSSQQPAKKFKKDSEDAGIAGKNGEELKGGHVEDQVKRDGANHQSEAASNDKDNKSSGDNANSAAKSEEELQKVIKELQKCQQKISSCVIKQAFSSALEQEFNDIRRPFIEERDELIKKIPDFWVQSFINHPTLTTILDEEDEKCLHHLKKIEVEEFDDAKSGFRIKFHFDDNPYFENKVLIKEFHQGSGGGEPAPTSTPINWKNTEWAERLREQAVNRSKNDKSRKRKSSGPSQTFFSWYLHYGGQAVDDIAKILKEEMWLDPVQFFLIHDQEDEESIEDEEDYEEDEEDESVDDKSIDLDSEDDEADEEEEEDGEGDEGDDDEDGNEESAEEGEGEGVADDDDDDDAE
ncbi:protein SET [Tetranychus urticae]|uniref:Uncharacterized protein n=1 Tax=Tetranychus urticae TaxID=32264 RepID=T1KBD1_TETUR|nr:protein SET [Tetranychus urticae]